MRNTREGRQQHEHNGRNTGEGTKEKDYKGKNTRKETQENEQKRRGKTAGTLKKAYIRLIEYLF